MPNVCHLIRGFLRSTETFIANQIINHQDYVPFLIYCKLENNPLSWKILDRIKHLECVKNSHGVFLYKYFRRLTKLEELNCVQFVKNNNIDILHVHYGPDYYTFLNVIKMSGKPSVVSFYGYDASSFQYQYWGFGKHILDRVFETADYCLVMSEDMKLDLITLGCPVEKIIIHYFGCELSRFGFEKGKINKDEFIFLTIASLVPKKGHLQILKAINILYKDNQIDPNKIKFRFVGDGPLMKELSKYSHENGIENFIQFTGHIDYTSPDYLNELKNADVFLHPSLKTDKNEKEGIPTSLVEAMASGLPIISTNHAGIPSVISDHFNGLLIQENNHVDLSSTIKLIITDHQLREKLGMNAKIYASNSLDVRKKTWELENIYDELLKNII